MSRRRRRILALLSALAATVVLADVGIGRFLLVDGNLFFGRPLPPFGALNHPRQEAWLAAQREALAEGRPSNTVGVFDPELGWTTRPGGHTLDGDENVGGTGARAPGDYPPEPAPDRTRLCCFGDSYTWCSEVRDEETWERYLEEETGVEAMNFGVPSYGTDQALLRMRRVAPRWSPDVLVMGVLVENIGRNVNRYRPLYYPSSGTVGTKPRFVLDGDGLSLLPQPYASRADLVAAIADGSVIERTEDHEYWHDATDLGLARHSSLLRLAIAWWAYARRQPAHLWADTEGEPFQVTLRLLEAFEREARELGAHRTLVLVFPREKELGELASGRRPWQTLLDALAERGIPSLDVSDALLPHYERWRAEKQEPTFRGGHLSGPANRIVAHEIAAWLREHPR